MFLLSVNKVRERSQTLTLRPDAKKDRKVNICDPTGGGGGGGLKNV